MTQNQSADGHASPPPTSPEPKRRRPSLSLIFQLLIIVGVVVAVATNRMLPEHEEDLPLDALTGENVINFDLTRQINLSGPDPVFPDALASLDGQQVQMLAFMAPLNDLNDMTNCMLMPISAGCFFCAPPSEREVVFVRQDADMPEFIEGPVVAEGTLRLQSDDSDDPMHHGFLVIIDQATVRPLS